MQICSQCQYPNPDERTECFKCNADLAPPTPEPEPLPEPVKQDAPKPRCIKCDQELQIGWAACPACGNALIQPRSSNRTTHAGDVLIAIGIVIGLYFLAIYDTSVAVHGGDAIGIDRVNNIGLMQNRLIGIIVAVVMIVVGAFMRIAEGFNQDRQ